MESPYDDTSKIMPLAHELAVWRIVIQKSKLMWELVLHTLNAFLGCMPKMMLPALWTSCLKDSHTNCQSYKGIGIAYFGKFTPLYAKNDAASNTN